MIGLGIAALTLLGVLLLIAAIADSHSSEPGLLLVGLTASAITCWVAIGWLARSLLP